MEIIVVQMVNNCCQKNKIDCQNSTNLINFSNPYAVSSSLDPPWWEIYYEPPVCHKLSSDVLQITFGKKPFPLQDKLHDTTPKHIQASTCIAHTFALPRDQQMVQISYKSTKLVTSLPERNSCRQSAQKGNPGKFEFGFGFCFLNYFHTSVLEYTAVNAFGFLK